MPRRLGDDPLARARSARAAEVSQLDTGSRTQAGLETRLLPPHDNVFFQRRTMEEVTQATLDVGATAVAASAPEITEISEIPEIKDLVVAPEPSGNADGASLADAAEATDDAASRSGALLSVQTPIAPVSPEIQPESSSPGASEASDGGAGGERSGEAEGSSSASSADSGDPAQ